MKKITSILILLLSLSAFSGMLIDGSLRLKGSSSGQIAIQAPATPTSGTLTLPLATGASGSVLGNDGSGILSWVMKADDISSVTLESTGFVFPNLITTSYDSTTRKVTLGGNTTFYSLGKPITSMPTGWVSDAHPTATGTYYLSFDPATATASWSTTPWTFDKGQIEIVNYQTAYKFGIKETHGLMQWQGHQNAHSNQGTYLASGADLSSFVLNSTTAANRRPDISAGNLWDEDNPAINPSITTKSYTQLFLSGTGAITNFSTAQADIVPLLTNNPYYNQFTGGAWQQTLLPNNAYQAIFVLAIPVSSDAGSQLFRYAFVQGQTQSTTLTTIQALTTASINLGNIASQLPEFVFVGKIIIRFTAGNWVLTSVEKLAGNRANQTATPAGLFLSTVSTSADFVGSGVAADPLALTATNSTALATLTGTANAVTKFSGSGLTSSSISDNGSLVSASSVDINMTSGKYFYYGDPNTNGTIRMYQNGNALIKEKRILGVYSEISREDDL